ncbi:MAG TPA: tetratricopeptide repeat protein [Pirellulales bacterium]|jgi:tetratricopeptide (TPR) repeat protein
MRVLIRPIAIAVFCLTVALAVALAPWSLALNAADRNHDPQRKVRSPGSAAQGAPEFETRFLALLVAGQQNAAEHVLASELARFPKASQLVQMIGRSSDQELHDYKMQSLGEILPAQRALFLQAACERSRFDIVPACNKFNAVWMLDRGSVTAQCAYHVLWMDSQQLAADPPSEVERAFRGLRDLADKNPDDLMIRWMLAVQCRNWQRNEEGVAAYKLILQHWQPGPAYVHQTYANLLDGLGRYEDALVERRVAVKMEQAYWTYDGLGVTLDHLSRFDEANAAHATATRMNPGRSENWSNWAISLNGLGKYDKAIEKCQQALRIDPSNGRAYRQWGTALAGQGRPREALEKCKTAASIYGESAVLDEYIDQLQRQIDEE